MGLLGRLTGWDQQGDAHNAVVAIHFLQSASRETKLKILTRIIEIQQRVKKAYAGSTADIIHDLDCQPLAVQMNFVALACNSLSIQPGVRGLHFNDVQNPYLAKGEDTLERISGVVKFLNNRFDMKAVWPGNSSKVTFSDWTEQQQNVANLNYPVCDQTLRVPSGKRLNIVCPKCETKWSQKT